MHNSTASHLSPKQDKVSSEQSQILSFKKDIIVSQQNLNVEDQSTVANITPALSILNIKNDQYTEAENDLVEDKYQKRDSFFCKDGQIECGDEDEYEELLAKNEEFFCEQQRKFN